MKHKNTILERLQVSVSSARTWAGGPHSLQFETGNDADHTNPAAQGTTTKLASYNIQH